MIGTIDFYFDFLSPFAYLAQQRLPAIADRFGCTLSYRPVDLARLKLLARNTGPATREMPIKLAYMRADMQRWAHRYGVSLHPLKSYDSARLNRGTLFAAARGMAHVYVDYAWRRVYGEGADLADRSLLSEIASRFGWSQADLVAFIDSPGATKAYEESTQEAHRRGAFGVPSMMIGDRLWWGNDRLEFLEEHLVAMRNDTDGSAA